MWAIIKINKNKLNYFKKDFIKFFDSNFKIYTPKIKIKNSNKTNVKISKEVAILGDYIFCFHASLGISNKLNYIKRFRGLKLFVEGHIYNQNEIIKFIKRCKENEDKDGYLLQDFFDKELNKTYKFLSGPFTNSIFNIISLQKNKLQATIGNIKTTISTKDILFRPV
jgi:hypothetical protein